MDKSASLTAKILVLVAFALVFGATMVALSVHHSDERREYYSDSEPAKTIERTFSVQANGRLVLDTDAGDVAVTGSDSDRLNVVVKIGGSASQREKFNVDFSQDGNTVTIHGRSRRRFFNFFGDDYWGIQFEIQVPKDFNLDLKTAGGDVALHTIKGTVQGTTSGGDIDADAIDGPANLSTSGGNVRMMGGSGDIVLRTSGGDVHCEAYAGTMDVESSGGDIIVGDSDGKLMASTSGGDIRVELKDNKGMELSTSGGSISVKLPASISARVDATTTGGEVSCEFSFSGKIKDGSMQGTINGGGNVIHAETSGGDIVIRSTD